MDRVDYAGLAAAIRAKKGTRGLTAIVKESGVSAPALRNLLEGEAPDVKTCAAVFSVCAWLGVEARTFLIEGEEDEVLEAG